MYIVHVDISFSVYLMEIKQNPLRNQTELKKNGLNLESMADGVSAIQGEKNEK